MGKLRKIAVFCVAVLWSASSVATSYTSFLPKALPGEPSRQTMEETFHTVKELGREAQNLQHWNAMELDAKPFGDTADLESHVYSKRETGEYAMVPCHQLLESDGLLPPTGAYLPGSFERAAWIRRGAERSDCKAFIRVADQKILQLPDCGNHGESPDTAREELRASLMSALAAVPPAAGPDDAKELVVNESPSVFYQGQDRARFRPEGMYHTDAIGCGNERFADELYLYQRGENARVRGWVTDRGHCVSIMSRTGEQ